MGILKRLRIGWDSMTTMDKVKVVLDTVCGIGCAAVMDDVAQKHCQGKNVVEKVAIRVSTTGLAMAAGAAAGKALGEAMDDYMMLYKLYKDEKKAKEDNANA